MTRGRRPDRPRRVPYERSIAAVRPSLLAEIDQQAWAAAGADPAVVGASSHWLAPWTHTLEDGTTHNWDQQVMSRTQMGAGCSVCRGYRPDASTSLASRMPYLSTEWHPQRNGDLTTFDIAPGSHKVAWWLCSRCKYEWKVPVYARAKDGNGCRRCAGQVALPGDAATLAIAAPDLYAELDQAAIAASGTDPGTIHRFSNRIFLWRCSTIPSHRFSTSPNRRHNGGGCPCCPSVAQTSRQELHLLTAVTAAMGDAMGNSSAGATRWLNSRGRRIPARCDVVVSSRQLVIEYDGLVYHRHGHRVANDHAKTAALLADGWRVVRLRERTNRHRLSHLDLQDPNLLQMGHRYGDPFDPVTDSIIRWLDDLDGSSSPGASE